MESERNFVLVHHTHDEDIEVAHQKRLLELERKREQERRKRLIEQQQQQQQGGFDDGLEDEDEDDDWNDLVVPDLARNMYMNMFIRCDGKDVLLKREIDGPLPPTLGRIAKKFKMKADDVVVETGAGDSNGKSDATGSAPPGRKGIAEKAGTQQEQQQQEWTGEKTTDAANARDSGDADATAGSADGATTPTITTAEADVRGNPINVNSKDPSKLSNYWAFRQGCTLVLGEHRLPVYHHAPVVVSLFVRGFPMVGSMLHPMATLHNCTTSTCRWAWYRTRRYAAHKVIEAIDAFGQHANISVSEDDGDVLVATTHNYTPTEADVGYRLVCACTPMNELCSGITCAVLVGSRDDAKINSTDFYAATQQVQRNANKATAHDGEEGKQAKEKGEAGKKNVQGEGKKQGGEAEANAPDEGRASVNTEAPANKQESPEHDDLHQQQQQPQQQQQQQQQSKQKLESAEQAAKKEKKKQKKLQKQREQQNKPTLLLPIDDTSLEPPTFTPRDPDEAAALCLHMSRSVCTLELHPVVEARHTFAQSRELSPGMLRVVSYNILHDMFCDAPFALTNLYPYLDPAYAKTNYRHRRIAEEIAGYLPDFVCLQEVGHAEFHEVLEPRLGAAGLHGVYANKISQQRWGMATFFRRERWSLLEAHRLNLTRQWRAHPVVANVAMQQPELTEQLESSTTVAQLLLLQCADGSRHYTGQQLCVVNCHLFSHPMAPHVRVIQAAVIATEVRERFGDVAVIWCGDFNANPASAAAQFLHSKAIEAAHPVWAEGACITRFKSKTKAEREANWHSVFGDKDVRMARSFFRHLSCPDTQRLSLDALFAYTDAHDVPDLKSTDAFAPGDASGNRAEMRYQDFFGALVDLRLEDDALFNALHRIAPSHESMSMSSGAFSPLPSSAALHTASTHDGSGADEDERSQPDRSLTATPNPTLTKAAISSATLTVPTAGRARQISTTSIVSMGPRGLSSGFGASDFSMALRHDMELHCSVRQPTYSAGKPVRPEQVDYVFYTPHVQMRMEQPPTFAMHHIKGGLPNRSLPSDHVASVVDFAWNRRLVTEVPQ